MECLLRYLYIFDVGDEIETNKIEKILNRVARIFDIKLEKTIPTHIRIKDLPLKISIGKIKQENFDINLSTKIFSTGSISIVLDIQKDIKSLDEIKEILNKINFEKIAKETKDKICKNMEDCIVNFKKDGEFEEFLTIFLKVEKNVEEFVDHNKDKIAKILEFDEVISKKTIDEIMKSNINYYENELIIVSWSGAICINIDNDEIEKISFIFEIANLQHLELRVYDYEIDELLKETIKKLKIKWYKALFGGMKKEIEKIIERRMEIQDTVESAINMGKFFGDWYYAKVYEQAKRELHIDEWRNSIMRKIDYIEEFYKSLQNSMNSTRSLFLELMIVIIFILDLIIIIAK
ncbi:MAG: hypothetical protein QXG91_01290 [Candidatus Aenigmatarchaeota archaeon]